ncbi:hypothetical protein [Glaciimonas sp. PCH181]|uniref:hypothetical protein n=1 Tax=Glaciimonas sp. PCH181 TaxID=2133943 RepID=UPI000D399BE1|nr:hypothetical protein [Glaciimonas sp. PCH181]PUA18854.1 hypothetical protein C7W93_02760 [Glaciimonas sp. PCH181]
MDSQSKVSGLYPFDADNTGTAFDLNASGVSWGAIFAGAAAAAALSLVLVILGSGLGLSAISPWSTSSVPMGKATIIWLAFTQLAAAGIGGYIAGRLRVKWASVHTDEVYFRDTAHGLLSWAVATLVTAIFLTGAVRVISGAALEAGGTALTAGAAATGLAAGTGGTANSISYFSDMLMRGQPNTALTSNNTASTTATTGQPAAPATQNAAPTNMSATDSTSMRAEVVRIFANDLRTGTLSPDDKQYLSGEVARRTGMSSADADKRVDDVFGRLTKAKTDAETAAKNAADQARTIAAHSALWIFVALLIGAFFASLMATFGGKQRDRVQGNVAPL